MSRKHFYIGLLILLFVMLLFDGALRNFAPPRTSLANQDVSFLTKSHIRNVFRELEKQKVIFIIKNRMYTYTYEELGATIDEEQTLMAIFGKDHLLPPMHVYRFLQGFLRGVAITPSLSYNDRFQNVEQALFDLTPQFDDFVFAQDGKTLIYNTQKEIYTIDTETLKKQLRNTIEKGDAKLLVHILRVVPPNITPLLGAYTDKLDGIFRQPVTLVLRDDNTTKRITLTPHELASILGARLTGTDHELTFTINEDAFRSLLLRKDKELLVPAKDIDFVSLRNDLAYLLSSRVLGISSDTVFGKIRTTANTQGTLVEKYIEIDISQQLMYLWEAGRIVETHPVSTGKYYPTPTGKFQILNKVKNAYSDIFDVWMSYWMGFYYAPDVKASLGIHELPYAIAQDNEEIRQSTNSLGMPSTGGCVSLAVGVAKRIFEWSEVGTPVYIFQ